MIKVTQRNSWLILFLFTIVGFPVFFMSPQVVSAATSYDGNSASIVYTGSWTSGSGSSAWPSAFNNTVRFTNSANASATLTFTGSSVEYIWAGASNRGTAKIYIDNILIDSIDMNTPEIRWQVSKIYQVPSGSHTIKIQAVGDGYIDVDALIVNPSYMVGGLYDNAISPYIRYAGPSWTHASGFPSAHNGTVSFSNNPGDSVTFRFYGQSAFFKYTAAYNRGIAALTIDGVNAGYIDQYSNTTVWQKNYPINDLDVGIHTVTLTVLSTSLSSSNYIDIDAAAGANFFAGYSYHASSLGVGANLPFANPSTPVGFSTEWVMVGNRATGGGYVQVGWIKFAGNSVPQGFTEWNNDPQDTTTGWNRILYPNIDANLHYYNLNRTGNINTGNWCSYIDGVQKDCVSVNIPGFAIADIVYYSGETIDLNSKLGGTQANPFRMTVLQFRQSSDGQWFQVNTNALIDITTINTPYRANKGINGPETFMQNWTQ